MSVLSQRTFKYMQKQENLDYSKGYNSYLANDVVPSDQLVYATDTRISTLGRQRTRQGCDFYSVPAGETLNAQQTSVTGAADQAVGVTQYAAAKFTTTAAGRLTRVDLNIKKSVAFAPIIIEIRADNAGTPSTTVLAQSSIPGSAPTGVYAYLTARFIEAPLLSNATVYWIVAYNQSDGTGLSPYYWSSTTTASTAKTSSDSGVTWSAAAFDLNFKTYLSTDGGVLGAYRAYKSDGTKVQLIAYKEAAGTTAVATINDATGALTNIKTGLSASATRYDFAMASDVVYYVNGYDAPRKWDFTTESAMGGSPEVSSQIILHKSRMFFISAVDPTKIFFSDIAAFETFTSTNFIYVPNPKSPDPIVRQIVLNDNLYLFTRTTKWALAGSDLTNMVLRKVPGTKGTKAPASVVVTRNHVYFASDDGLYRFNGSTDELLSQSITGDYLNAANRTTMAGAIYKGRYYVWYTPSGAGQNSECWVYNIDHGHAGGGEIGAYNGGYDSMESRDTGAYIASALVWDGPSDSGQFLQASSLVGALYYGELGANTYNNLGRALTWELRTKYDHFGSPATKKRVKRWYPRFAASSTVYSAQCQYDLDFAGSPTTLPANLRGSGVAWGAGATWGSGYTWGVASLVTPKLNIPGTAQFIQQRYLRKGVNMPVEFYGSSIYYFIRRPR